MQQTHTDLGHRPRGTWGSAISRILRARARRTNNRRGYHELMALDDRILRDIGITRDMLRHEMLKSSRWLV